MKNHLQMTNKTQSKSSKKPTTVLKNFNIQNSSEVIRVKSDYVKNKNLTSSSRKWIKRHINDPFTQKSIAFGYRARSAFKLIEIQEKFNIIKNNTSVLDLGCAPGSWTEILIKLTKKTVIGIDLLPTESISGAIFLEGDFLDSTIQQEAIKLNNFNKFDCIVSDIAPNTTGMHTVDHLRIMYILEIEIQFILKNLSRNGSFVTKVFQGEGLDEYLSMLREMFKSVNIFKPKASRKESKEVYLICIDFLK
jgi:23S rRNA (uridine2552-2'-O)-methyltransferase